MVHLTSPSWWLNQFITVFMTMCFIYIIKAFVNKFNVPVAKTIVDGV